MRGPIGSLRDFAAKLVAIVLVVVLVLGQAPAQLWAEGAEGLARVSIELTGAEGDAGGTDDAAHGERAEKLSELEPDGAADDASGGDVGAGADSPGAQQHAHDARDASSAQGAERDVVVQPSAATAAQPTATHNVERTSAQTLSVIVDQLEADDWRLEPTYGVDTNANDLLLAQLAEMGVEDVEVRVSSAEIKVPNDNAELGISCADDATNGDITYFYMDPDAVGFTGFVTYRQITPTFTLSRGDERAEFTPTRSTQMPWDETRVETMLREDVATLALGYAAGDHAGAVTQDIVLPYKLAGKSWSTVEWTSSNKDVIEVTGYGWEDYTASVARPTSDAAVVLTATVGVVSSGGPEATVDVSFEVTVKADAQAIEDARAALQEKVDTAFTTATLTYSEDGSPVDASAVSGDLQLPRTSAIGIDGKYYTVEYTASSDAIRINGYRGNVYQPLPDAAESAVSLTLTVTSKDTPAITASKSIDLVVAPLDAADIEAELALMDAAQDGYAAALLDGQDAGAVTGDLATFQKAYRDADGNLAWARSVADTAGDGIVTDDLEPDDDMGVVAGHWFKSSNVDVVAHDTLRVTQPAYDAEVTVTSALSSERYARYGELYADDATWGATFARLASQPVSATFTVKGTLGAENPDITASISIVGTDAFGEDQVWASRTDCVVEQGATAADLIEQTLADAGLAHEATGAGGASYYLSTITAPDGRVLGWDEATGKYWQLFVNGAASAVGAGEVVLESGDEVALYYSAWGASPDDIGKAKITVSAQVIGPDEAGVDTSWAPLTELSLPQGSTAADLTERAFALAGLEADTGTGSYGWYLNSITSPFTGEVLGTTETADGGWRYWQLFVNGTPSDLGAGSVVLNPGDQVVWYYSEWGASLPENEVAVDPGAWDDRPNDWTAEWQGFAPGAVEGVTGPTEGGELAWSVSVGSNVGSANAIYQSDPVIVNGRVYVAVGDTLKVYRAQDGQLVDSTKLATTIDSAARMVYADGLIVVPLHSGRLQVLTVDTLRTVSLSPAVASGQQALSSITVSGGYAYVGTTTVGGDAGVLYCVNLRTGALRWSVADDAGAGYYWTGGVLAGGYYAAIDSAGTVTVRDVATGSAVSTLALGEDARAQLLADPDDASTLYAVTRDGVLHRIALGEDGSLAETGSVAFAASSTSTPVIAGGYAYVGGGTAAFTGVLAVIDLSHMQVVHAITTYADGTSLPGAVQSTPAVAVQDGATYVYFTCNAAQGSAYLYRVGDAEAKLLYQPEDGKTGWCLSSIAVGSDGALYYLNDSGHLFRIDAGPALEVTGPGEGAQVDGGGNGDDDASAAPLQQLVSKVVTTIRLRGTSDAEQDEGSSASLLEGYTSADVVRSLLVATPREGSDASQGDAASTTMPVWPFAGMALGALALVAAVASGRGDKERR